MKKINVSPPKKKNTGDGLPPFALIAILEKIIQIVAPNQFNMVAKGTIFAGIISGTYIHTIGPADNPKNSI